MYHTFSPILVHNHNKKNTTAFVWRHKKHHKKSPRAENPKKFSVILDSKEVNGKWGGEVFANCILMMGVNKVKEFEAEYIAFLEAKHKKILNDLKAGKFTDEITNVLEAVAKDLSANYK